LLDSLLQELNNLDFFCSHNVIFVGVDFNSLSRSSM